jgi:hypothetical protein
MNEWNEIFDYLMQHKEDVHVFGSKEMGWVRISWPGSSKMLYKNISTMKDAEHYLKHALRFVHMYQSKKADAGTSAQ